MRFFRLTDAGVRCGEEGLFVGAIPMLVRSPLPGGGYSWTVRPTDELDDELSDVFGLPIEAAAKRRGLAGVARALERGDHALAKITALLLRLPDPPSVANEGASLGSLELAEQLFSSGLLKDWDPAKHPRTQAPPNRGWFATKPNAPGGSAPTTRPPNAGEPRWRVAIREARTFIRGAAKEALTDGWEFATWSSPIRAAIEAALYILDSTPTNTDEDRVLAQLRSSLDQPKTLEEMQTPPTQNQLGYEQHHIVEQNPANIAKSPLADAVEKFGRAAIDDPSNIVWIPRLKHEVISAFYNSADNFDQAGRLHRLIVNELDYDSQYAAGLQALQMFGVLQ
jgi:hypothetical protein